MKQIRKYILITLLTASICSIVAQAQAQEYASASVGGIGYEESMILPSITPYIALCTVAAIGIVAVAVRHSHGHGHSHSH